MHVRLLIVESDMLVAAKMATQLTKLAYEVTGIVAHGEEAVRHVAENRPDIVLLDIHLTGPLDGIETAHEIRKVIHTPIIYVTTNTDEATFTRATETHPYAFIARPIKNIDLQRAIELTISRMADEHHETAEHDPAHEEAKPFVLSDRIFVRYKDKMVKIFIEDILFIEADRNYCHIYTMGKQYLLTTTLKVMEDKLPTRHFLRVHRSYMVNLFQIDEVGDGHIGIAGKTVPLSHLLRDDLLKRIQTI